MTMPSWARRGAKAVCIYDGPWEHSTLCIIRGPAYGDVVTVDGAYVDDEGDVLLFIREHRHAGEGYLAECFRPLIERTQEQDIATHFRDLLHVDHRESESA